MTHVVYEWSENRSMKGKSEVSRLDAGVKPKTKVCVVTTNRADFGRVKPVMEALQKEPGIELQVVVGSHLFFDHFRWYLRHGEPLSLWKSLPWYLKARRTKMFGSEEDVFQLDYFAKLLRAEGFPIHARIPMYLEGGNPRVMTKIAGFVLLGISDVFERLRPDVILINGDRFEMLPIAYAAACLNIRIAHIEGGDVSGTLDEGTRHAITKLAHIHFPATNLSARRIQSMGEDPNCIFVVGSPIIDTLKALDLSLDNSVYERNGMGGGERVDFTKSFLLVLHHPVTTRYDENRKDMEEIVAAIRNMPLQRLILSPNIDAGSDGVSEALRVWRDTKPEKTAFFKSFLPHDFYRIFSHAAVAVGNSSSFIREGAFLGVPAVIVGDRQQNRERGGNVIEVSAESDAIMRAIEDQLRHGRYGEDKIFGDGTASQRIASTLAGMDLSKVPLQKRFRDEYAFNI